MDLTRLKTLAGLNEGQTKHHIEDIAAHMDAEDFIANARDYGMDEMEATEFWMSVNGMDEASTVNGKDTTNEPKWKQTSMSPEEAKAKGYQVRVKKGALNNGDDMVEVLDEAVGEFAEPYFDLIDRVGGDVSLVNNEALAYLGSRARYDITDGDDNYEDYMSADDVANEITRYMNGDQIKDFVAHFERHYDLNSEEEMEEEYTLEAVDVEEEELTEAPTMDTTQLVNMLRNAGLNEEAIAQKLEEWANTPEGVGEVEPTEHGDAYDFAQGVNLSLKRYLDAQDMKVSVNESHTAESLMEAYAAYKGDIEEAAKPDFADIDGDGDKKETMKKAAKDKKEKEKVDEARVEEDDVKEGNAFSKALADAKKAGKEEFEVDGKKYKVNESEDLNEVGVNDIDDEECDNCGSPLHNGECPQCDAEEVEESADLARLRRLSGL